MDAEQIKQLATDVNNVAATSFQSGKEHFERPLRAKIEQLEAELKKKVTSHNTQVAELYAMANRARKEGRKEGLCEYAWWKDGVQYVGTCGTTLEEALNKTV